MRLRQRERILGRRRLRYEVSIVSQKIILTPLALDGRSRVPRRNVGLVGFYRGSYVHEVMEELTLGFLDVSPGKVAALRLRDMIVMRLRMRRDNLIIISWVCEVGLNRKEVLRSEK